MGTQKNRLNETVLLSNQNTCLMGKEINAILGAQIILIWTYGEWQKKLMKQFSPQMSIGKLSKYKCSLYKSLLFDSAQTH